MPADLGYSIGVPAQLTPIRFCDLAEVPRIVSLRFEIADQLLARHIVDQINDRQFSADGGSDFRRHLVERSQLGDTPSARMQRVKGGQYRRSLRPQSTPSSQA